MLDLCTSGFVTISGCFTQGKMDADRRQELVQQGKDLKETLAQLEVTLSTLQDSLQHEGQLLPNLAHPSVSNVHWLPKGV